MNWSRAGQQKRLYRELSVEDFNGGRWVHRTDTLCNGTLPKITFLPVPCRNQAPLGKTADPPMLGAGLYRLPVSRQVGARQLPSSPWLAHSEAVRVAELWYIKTAELRSSPAA